jgi:hypothetical protein
MSHFFTNTEKFSSEKLVSALVPATQASTPDLQHAAKESVDANTSSPRAALSTGSIEKLLAALRGSMGAPAAARSSSRKTAIALASTRCSESVRARG